MKSPVILVSAIAAFAFTLAASDGKAAEPTYLMPTGRGGGQPDNGIQPFDPNPAGPGSPTRQFLTYGADADGNTIPVKTVRITNNTANTIYPVIRDPNSKVLASNKAVGLYDPYDPPNMEYRGYIGYEEGGSYYFGLKTGQSILVPIPLVFWNGARIGIGTDGKYLAIKGGTLPNPLTYDANAFRSIANAATSNNTISNGVIMWYRAGKAEAPNDDTEDQLAEWTIRDHTYLVNPQITARTNSEIPDNELVTLMNYDVSNVDNLYLPVAMEANDVWVVPQGAGTGPNPNRTGWKPGSTPDVFGWTGAVNTIDFLQSKIRVFTADNNQLLGQYFGGKGWPYYNIPNPTNDPKAPLKIPSGANVFAQSPLRDVESSYKDGTWQTAKYMLSSGGTLPISATLGWAGGTPDPVGSTTLHLLADNEIFAFLEIGYLVSDPKADPPLPQCIQDGTTVTGVDRTEHTVTLSKPILQTTEARAFTFSRPVSDYASEAMIKLWYSWAQYYLAHWQDQTPGAPSAPVAINGTIDALTATLSFNEPHPELVKGMAVTGGGLDNAQTEVGVHQGNAIILEIAGDKKSVILSQTPATGSTNAPFTFHPPQALLYTPTAPGDPGYPLIGDKFVFTGEPAWHDPYTFSQQVYMIMASMNQIGQPNNNNISKFMQDIVGANMGYIFTDAAKATVDAQMVIAMIRDMIKSVLRGVTDFTKYPDVVDAQGNHTVWYPDPAEPHGNQPFNVFNLDPFVRFVHVNLGFTGYGFSVDDDTADVGAGGASQLQISVTETGGLKNTNPWTIQAPYGPIRNISLLYSGPASATNGDTLYNAIQNVSNTTPIRITTPSPHRLSDGQKVIIDQVGGDPAANGTFRIGNVSRLTFDLFDAATGKIPVAPTGTYTSGGRWAYPLHPYIDTIGLSMPGNNLTTVFYRITGDDALGTFLGTSVSVNGVDKNKSTGVGFRVWQLGRQDVGRLLLDADLTDANGSPLPAGTYSFTFFGLGDTITPPPTAVPTNVGNTAYLEKLGREVVKAKQIDDPEKRSRVLKRLRAWMRIVRRGVDPDSREGELKRDLINARTLEDPERREKEVERIKRKLKQLED
ncbi:MAG TPA: hypothetical protein VIM61_11800 [Chthoniobacterales bacterium]